MSRILSGVQPSGDFHIGNYFGAFRQWVARQDADDALYCIVDLHALTKPIAPEDLAQRTLECATMLLAIGLDPKRCTIFVQSQIPEHAQIAWLLACCATMGELRRMTQFKDLAANSESAGVGIFLYPVLMAGDILLYGAHHVPVGDDQRQHLELARDLAIRFNSKYGTTFVVPQAAVPISGARIMDLQRPENKMSKSVDSPLGTIKILDGADEIARKIKKAVTDLDGVVAYDPKRKPGVSNLLELLAACSTKETTPLELSQTSHYSGYGDLKDDVIQVLCDLLFPIQNRYKELISDRGQLDEILAEGAERAGQIASQTYGQAASAVGLLKA